MADLEKMLRDVNALAERAAAKLVAMQGQELGVERKELRDVITAADLASEEILLEGVRRIAPEAAILAEEAGASGAESDSRWIVDPLDGTVNYASGLPWFSVTIAYQEGGKTLIGVTHAPLMGLRAHYAATGVASINGVPAAVSPTTRLADAVVSVVLTSHFSSEEVARTAELVRRLGNTTRGVRIVISGAVEMSLVAAGKLDAFVGAKADIVSHAAAMPLIRAAGGRVSTLSGADSSDADLEKIVSNGRIHDELLAVLAGP